MNRFGRPPHRPVAPMANVINLWTFSAELVGAMNRLGKMPTLWQSMFVPGSDARNARIDKWEFDTEAKIQPVEAGTLGLQYITAAKSCLESMKANELAQFEKAGTVCADALNPVKGGCGFIGHYHGRADQNSRDIPTVFSSWWPTSTAEVYLRENLRGKVFLHVDTSYNRKLNWRFVTRSGREIVAVFTAGRRSLAKANPSLPTTTKIDVYIDPY